MVVKDVLKVSIVIPFYNCPYVDRAIESALAQTYRNVEVIVVDDGSTEHTERIDPYRASIHHIRKENGGTATALNEGIRLATGNYFSWLSSDDLYHPMKVERQLQFMLDHQAVISYGNYHSINERDGITAENLGQRFRDQTHFLRAMRSGCMINGCTVMAETNAIRSAGMFDETLPYTHDYDLWLRMLLNGHEFIYFPEPLIYYRIHGNMGSSRFKDKIPHEIHRVKKRYRDRINRYIKMSLPARNFRSSNRNNPHY